MNKRRVIVVGGGAAGMLAAYSAAISGAEVTLLEKNEKLGKKLYITGKGRCNVTNDCEPEELFKNVPRNPKFLMSAVYTFSPSALMLLLEKAGLPLKTERGGRVFPVSDKSNDVIRAFIRLLAEAGVRVLLNTTVRELIIREGAVRGVKTQAGDFLADAVILATGGISYPATGSTGDGHRLAATAGHTVTRLYPSLVPFAVREQAMCEKLSGLTLKNVELTLLEGKKKRFSERGELLFTHFGLSGPLVLSASAMLTSRDFKDTFVEIDMKPALTAEALDKRILRDIAENGGARMKAILSGLFPKSLCPYMADAAGIMPELRVSELSREGRARLVNAAKHFTLTVTGTRGMNEAIVTRGGVDVSRIDPSCLKSRIIGGLYFAGELIDYDCFTGGYNLQAAFATGYLAGMSAAEG